MGALPVLAEKEITKLLDAVAPLMAAADEGMGLA